MANSKTESQCRELKATYYIDKRKVVEKKKDIKSLSKEIKKIERMLKSSCKK